jgi:hypothetical protein
MKEAGGQRKDLPKFLDETGHAHKAWRILCIASSPKIGSVFDVLLLRFDQPQKFWRIHAHNTADFLIRPPQSGALLGGPEIKFSTDDPRLFAKRLQYVPGDEGGEYDPPRKYQLLEMDGSWIIAERFEIEPLPQITYGSPQGLQTQPSL